MVNRPTLLLVTGALLCAACGDDDGDASSCDRATPPPPTCTVTLAPGADDHGTVLTALLEATPGDVLCFDGTYRFDGPLSLTVDDVTLRGTGVDRAVFEFDGLEDAGSEGLRVDAVDGFTFDHIEIRNTPGDGLRVQASTNVTIRDAAVTWDGEPSTANGAYGFYPVLCESVLIEGSYAYGASDAGIYVGQSTDVVVRDNTAEGNVAGIEIENCVDSLVYGNTMSDNTGGLVIFDLPGLTMQGRRTLAYDNDIAGNNRPNFAPEGAKVGLIPAGTGVIIRNMDDVELRENTIANNMSAGVIVLGENTVCAVRGDDECSLPQGFDPYTERTFLHDNRYSDNGTEPQSTAALIAAFFGGTIGDIFNDGVRADGTSPSDTLCVQEAETVTFANLGPNPPATSDRDLAPYDCTRPPLGLTSLDCTVGQQ